MKTLSANLVSEMLRITNFGNKSSCKKQDNDILGRILVFRLHTFRVFGPGDWLDVVVENLL